MYVVVLLLSDVHVEAESMAEYSDVPLILE